jgi:hypothetical protein
MFAGLTILYYVETAIQFVEWESDEWKFEFGAATVYIYFVAQKKTWLRLMYSFVY